MIPLGTYINTNGDKTLGSTIPRTEVNCCESYLQIGEGAEK